MMFGVPVFRVVAPRPLVPQTMLAGPFDFVSDAADAVEDVATSVRDRAKDVLDAIPVPVLEALEWGGGLYLAGITYGAAGAFFIKTGMGVTQELVRGERIDRALRDSGRIAIKQMKTAAPFIQTGLAFIPGVGQSAAAALGAGIALAEGKGITEALIAAAAGSVPGGALAREVFNAAAVTVQALAEGKSIEVAALEAARSEAIRYAGDAGAIAFDTGAALAAGKTIQDAAIDGARNLIPEDPYARAAYDMAAAALRGEVTPATLTGAAREMIPNLPENVQSTIRQGDAALNDAQRFADEARRAKDYADQGIAFVNDAASMFSWWDSDAALQLARYSAIGDGARKTAGGAAGAVLGLARMSSPIGTGAMKTQGIAQYAAAPVRTSTIGTGAMKSGGVAQYADPKSAAAAYLQPVAGIKPAMFTKTAKTALAVGGVAGLALLALVIL